LALFATLGFLWFILCRDLSYEWSANEQYSYGWFVPFFAAFLFWLRYEDKGKVGITTDEGQNDGNASQPSRFILYTSYFILLAALLPIRLFEVANPDWRPLSWGHALTVVGFTLLVIGYWGGRTAVRHFGFPVCFILVAVPWLTPIEAPLVQGLMRLVASIAAETLTLFGIPAQLEGSLIRVSNGVVGVSEACSGVRSLQTSLMIGLLFGELKRLSVARRFALVGAALAIAFLANCGRAFFLVWIAATENLAAVEKWHDFAGYAIVGLVFLGTVALASWFARQGQGTKDEGRSEATPINREPITNNRSLPRPTLHPSSFVLRNFSALPPLSFVICTFSWLLLVEVSVSSWYRWHERAFVETPRWSVEWPESAPKFRSLPIDDNVRSTLRYDSGREASWLVSLTTAAGDEPMVANVTMFFFRWEPGSASILRARAHRPDICLPNTGWKMTHDDGVKSYQTGGGLALPFRHFQFIRQTGNGRAIYADAFFCQREDRVPPQPADRFDATAGRTGNWLRSDRVRVVREGLRNQGQQVMELVMMTTRQLAPTEAEAEFAKLVAGVVVRRKK
jgi:exosortase